MSRNPQPISATRLLVVEGDTDQMIFQEIIKRNAIANFQTFAAGGYPKLGKYLVGLEIGTGFDKVTLVVVVGDYDVASSFDLLANQVVSAGYTKPKVDRVVYKTRAKPDVAVLMVPSNPSGCIETLCFDAAREKWPELETPLADFISQTPANTWKETKLAKTRVQCVLSVTCEPHPDGALKDHWQKDEQYLLPVDGPAFADIVGYLKSL
jgi:hypothetical protein